MYGGGGVGVRANAYMYTQGGDIFKYIFPMVECLKASIVEYQF